MFQFEKCSMWKMEKLDRNTKNIYLLSFLLSNISYTSFNFLKNLSSRRYFVKLSEGKVYKFSSLQHREKG